MQDLPKIKSLRELPKVLLERGNNSEKGGAGVDVEKGGVVAAFFITLQFNCICYVCGEKIKFVLLHFDSSVF